MECHFCCGNEFKFKKTQKQHSGISYIVACLPKRNVNPIIGGFYPLPFEPPAAVGPFAKSYLDTNELKHSFVVTNYGEIVRFLYILYGSLTSPHFGVLHQLFKV